MTPRQPPQATRPRLALFDLDHTLLPIDSDYEWGEFTIRLGWCDRDDFGRCNEAFYADYQAGAWMCTTMCVLPRRPCAARAHRPQPRHMPNSCAR